MAVDPIAPLPRVPLPVGLLLRDGLPLMGFVAALPLALPVGLVLSEKLPLTGLFARPRFP
jgi:hypothetical protein